MKQWAPTPLLDAVEERYAAMTASEEAADAAWKEAYEAFVLNYAASHDEFTAEDCSLAYKADKWRPQPKEWRASGGIIQRLIKEKKIIRDGFGWSSMRGVPVPKFRRGL